MQEEVEAELRARRKVSMLNTATVMAAMAGMSSTSVIGGDLSRYSNYPVIGKTKPTKVVKDKRKAQKKARRLNRK